MPPFRSRTRVLCSLLAAGLLGCSSEKSPSSVLIVTLDTVRMDALETYGGPAAVPTFDRIAREGALFDEAISPCPITLPSHTTILTGRFPISHGIHNNAVSSLSPEAETLAEVLARRDYHTSAVIGALPLASEYGLDQGFAIYDDEWPEAEEPYPFEYHQRRAGAVTDAAIAALGAPLENGEPFFQWVHYYDPHFGYLPPPPFDELYRDDLYSGEIAYTDRELGRLLEFLERAGRLDDTLVIVTSDHGEALGEHGEAYHGSLVYDATQRVPLAMRWPGRIPAGRVLSGQVTLADIFPTVVDLLGVPIGPDVQGRSLASWLRGGPPATTPYVYLEAAMLAALFNTTPVRGLRGNGYKYIHHIDAPELYDLVRDPRETEDLGREDVERAEKLRESFRALAQELQAASTVAESRSLSAEEQEAMRRLGYLGTQSRGTIDWEPKRELDPRPYVADVGRQLMQEEMLFFLERDRLDLATWQLDRLPDDGNGAFLRGKYFERTGELETAAEAYEEALRLGVRGSPAFAGGKTWTQGERLLAIGQALRRLGRKPRAADAFRQAAAELDRPELLVTAADCLEPAQAQPLLDIAQRYPRPAVAPALADYWLERGELDRAGEVLRQAEKRWPRDLGIVLALADWEERHGTSEVAKQLLERAAELPGGAAAVRERSR